MKTLKTIFVFFFYFSVFNVKAQSDSIYYKKTGSSQIIVQCIDRINHRPKIFSSPFYGLFVSSVQYILNDKGSVTEMSYLDTLGNKTYDSDSIYLYKMKEDPQEIYSETQYYYLNNVEAHPGDYWLHDKKKRELESGQIRMNDTAKINFWKTTYNKNGQILNCIFYSGRDTVAESIENYSIINYKYDTKGNFLGLSYLNSHNELVNFNNAFSFTVYKYNDRNKVTEIAWYDKDSILVDPGFYLSDYAKILFSYDKKGRLSEINLLNLENAPSYGSIDYNEIGDCYKKGHLCQEYYKPFSKKIYKYNVFGQIVSEEYFDEYSKNIAGSYYKYFLCFYRSANVLPH